MKRLLALSLLLLALGTAVLLGTQHGSEADAAPIPKAPASFFGIGPQEMFSEEDLEYMKAGGIGSVRIAVSWAAIQPTRKSGYLWAQLDQAMAMLAKNNLEALPFLYQTPRWLAPDIRTLPVTNPEQRKYWRLFLKAIVKRYKPNGDFWTEHSKGGTQYQTEIPRPKPIRQWQIWNEANFFYFAYPVSPGRYGQLVSLSGGTIKSVDPSAKVILSGLFGEPAAKGKRGMNSTQFLQELYRRPGIKAQFDGVALHPYSVDSESLEELIEAIHEVTVENHDRPALYITELGWGSQNNFREVAFEQGPRGQAEQLRDSYRFMIENRARLNLKAAYWFSWKDLAGSCNFCDSVGLFKAGKKFVSKPAWNTFRNFSGGTAKPQR